MLVTGVMAAGKATVAQLLAERFERSAHLRGDRFRRMIVRGNAAPNTDAFEAELRLRYTLGAQSADGYAGDWTVAQLDRILRDETPPVGHWIDNSDQTPEQTVEAILARLE